MIKYKIAVIEDDRDINELIAYNIIRSLDGGQGLFLIQKERPDLVLLDLMLPGMDGLEICQALKQADATKDIPIIMITAKGEESDIVVGLQMGADDYINKPFSIKVLLARVKAVFRRGKKVAQTASAQSVRDFGAIVIDLLKHKISIRGEAVVFTAIEFAIIEFLSRSPGRVYTRDQILDNVWKEGKFIIDRAVDVHVRGLRKKMGDAADFIETVRGVGYRFKEEE
jgi:DNA-binding response OmpR family regulator